MCAVIASSKPSSIPQLGLPPWRMQLSHSLKCKNVGSTRLPSRYVHNDADHGVPAGSASAAMTGVLTGSMLRTVQARLDAARGDLDGLLMTFGVERLEDLPASKVNEVLRWIDAQA